LPANKFHPVKVCNEDIETVSTVAFRINDFSAKTGEQMSQRGLLLKLMVPGNSFSLCKKTPLERKQFQRLL
jgi:hypothetical protein